MGLKDDDANGMPGSNIFRRISTSKLMGGCQAQTRQEGDPASMPNLSAHANNITAGVVGSNSNSSAHGPQMESASPTHSGAGGQPVNVQLQLHNTGKWNLAWWNWPYPQSKSEQLCSYFGLPQSETFLDDYNCALRRGFLHQGRMYVFDHYVCFDSLLFGFAKKLVIPLEHVKSIKKRTNLRIPNSIKIEVVNPQGEYHTYFFTSFLSRDDAFQLISNCLEQTSLHHRNQPDMQLAPQGGALAPAGDDSMPGELHGAGASAGPQGASEDRATAGSLSNWQGGAMSPAGSQARSRMAHRPSSGFGGGSPRNRGGPEQDDEDEEGEECEGVWCEQVEGPPPPVAGDAQVVIQAVLQGTPRQLFQLVWADESTVLEDFLQAQGNRRTTFGSWTRDSQLGLVRTIQFISPIKGAFANWGVATTQCMQSHRFRRFQGDYLVFESSQTMNDIPYGDCFTVDMRWDVTPLVNGEPLKPEALSASEPHTPMGSPFLSGAAAAAAGHPMSVPNMMGLAQSSEPPQIQVSISVRVPFSRRCLFKRVIESGAVKQVKETYSLLVAQLTDTMAQLASEQAPVQLGAGRQISQATMSMRPEPSLAGLPSLDPGAGNGHGHLAPAGPQGSLASVNSRGRQGGMPRSNSLYSHMGKLGSDDSQLQGRDSLQPQVSGRPRVLSRFASMPGGVVRGMQALVSRDAWAGAGSGGLWSPQLWLTLLVLCVQLLVLASTWRHAGRHAIATSRAVTSPQLGPAGSGDADLLLAAREMWSQRAALLQTELELMQQHVTAVAQQLQYAMSRAAADAP